ncbi:CRISPR-associated helicase Cas3' [Thermodesulfomicrobium sp. WS]|uniref:type I-G CRISPR-associated helicase/endonuclease Cas3g n=1 Tax=Thermodesulfomicrobium sp. WS TaxID=3004129 RepID=UPI00248F792C|nr:CRISPR-associated helicase Cas3' [Thermodesulfomicrobium sp. WS]
MNLSKEPVMLFACFDEMFQGATGCRPYPYQSHLAQRASWPDLLEAPTGAGKTEAIVLAWLWRRRFAESQTRQQTPRRLVYCLPMRVLVEQTEARVRRWMDNLKLAEEIGVHVLMGGETDNDWDLYPEREAVLIGTQDMLLSRALNRGYALGRAHWPLPYGLLNNDCLWVFDEVQLMGSGLATSAQLAAFREKFGVWGQSPTLWVSATLRPEWLATVDFRPKVASLDLHGLMHDEWQDATSDLARRLNACKALSKARNMADDPKKLAEEIHSAHQNGQLTLVVVNTVKKAAALYEALRAATRPTPRKGKKTAEQPPSEPAPDLLLLHSRFRPPERKAKLQQLLEMEKSGGIVIATQVVEAGVDISARTLFTELSPWASFVQRVGRCNRKGEFEQAEVFWVDVDTGKKGGAAPYTPEELEAARKELKALSEVGPRALHDYLAELPEKRLTALYPYAAEHVIRRRTVEELFDTTPDLTGADIDISLYIRENDEHDVQVFWRDWEGDTPNRPEPQPEPGRDELCPTPLNKETRDWLSKNGWRWDFLEDRWTRAERITPGQIYLLHASVGGYSAEKGFDISLAAPVTPLGSVGQKPEGNESDPWSTERKIWQTIAAHTNQVVEEMDAIVQALGNLLTAEEMRQLRHAARWHDWGKAYYVFQNALTATAQPDFDLPDALHCWGKSARRSAPYEHPHFRHELASALAMLAQGHPDLAWYLVAAHHGKVRVSIRSLPGEKPAPDGKRFARGVWEGDRMPPVKLGGGVTAPEVTFSLAPMELGLSEDGRPSWAERVLQLLENYGPFRLAYLEALLCAADRRASAKAHPEVS